MSEDAQVPQWDVDLEEQQLYQWRRARFVEDGFTLHQSVRLANDGADHHRAEALLKAGCPLEIVYKLLKAFDEDLLAAV